MKSMKVLSTFATIWQGNDDHMEAKAIQYNFNVTLFAKTSIKILGRKMITKIFGKSFSSVFSFCA